MSKISEVPLNFVPQLSAIQVINKPNKTYVTFCAYILVPTQRTRTTLVVRVRPICEQVTTVKYLNEGHI